jgi:hypothetical protein
VLGGRIETVGQVADLADGIDNPGTT